MSESIRQICADGVQSTDKKVNEITPPLFKAAPDAASMAQLPVSHALHMLRRCISKYIAVDFHHRLVSCCMSSISRVVSHHVQVDQLHAVNPSFESEGYLQTRLFHSSSSSLAFKCAPDVFECAEDV